MRSLPSGQKFLYYISKIKSIDVAPPQHKPLNMYLIKQRVHFTLKPIDKKPMPINNFFAKIILCHIKAQGNFTA